MRISNAFQRLTYFRIGLVVGSIAIGDLLVLLLAGPKGAARIAPHHPALAIGFDAGLTVLGAISLIILRGRPNLRTPRLFVFAFTAAMILALGLTVLTLAIANGQAS
jgi:hypothetical protein